MGLQKRRGVFFVFFFLFVSFILAAGVQEWKGEIKKEEGITVIVNPDEPIYKEPIFSLTKEWQIGGAEAEGEYLIERPESLAVDDEGNLYVLDSKAAVVKVYNPKGKFLRSIGRKGQGPGELNFPLSLSLNVKKKELAIVDIRNRRISFFNLEGKFLRSIPLKIVSNKIKIDSQGNVLVHVVDRSSLELVLKRFKSDMSQGGVDIFRFPLGNPRDPFAAQMFWTVTEEDKVIVGDPRSYEIYIYDSALNLEKKIKKHFKPVKVTAAEKEEIIKRTPPEIRESGPSYKFSEKHAAFQSFFLDDKGHLFVQTWERTSAGQNLYDIFDPEGKFIGRVALSPHPYFRHPLDRLVKNNCLYTIEPTPDGYEVVCKYSLQWKIGNL